MNAPADFHLSGGPPVPDDETMEFWEGARRGELMIEQCTACRAFAPAGTPRCLVCLGELVWVPASGRGTLYSWSIVHDQGTPRDTAVALVDLDEGIRLLTGLAIPKEGELRIGIPVRVSFLEDATGVAVPYFEPCEEDARDDG